MRKLMLAALLGAAGMAFGDAYDATLRVTRATGLGALFVGAEVNVKLQVDESAGTLAGELISIRQGGSQLPLPSSTDYRFQDLPATVERRAEFTVLSTSATAEWGVARASAITAAEQIEGGVTGVVNGMTVELFGRGSRIAEWLPTNRPSPVVTNAPPPPPASGRERVHVTNFLRKNASWTPHVFFSPKLTDAAREDIIRTLAADGYTRIYLYTANSGDYGSKSLRYSHDQREAWRGWLVRMRAAGLEPVLWIRADDSGDLDRWSEAQWKAHIDLVVADLNDLALEYTIGLEVNEYWAKAFNSSVSTTRLVQHLQARSGKRVGVHTTGISAIAYATQADVYYLQYGFGKSPAEVVARTKEARGKLRPGQTLIAAEYHKSGESDEARRLGDAAVVEGGADGAGNGCTMRAIQALLQRTGGLTNGPPPPPVTNAVPSGLTFARGGAYRYVRWSPAVDRSGWPIAHNIKGKPDGLLYGARVGEPLRKVEWIKPGRNETGLKNAYDDVNDPKYDQGWRPGDRVVLEIRDVDGKLRSPAHRGEWVLQ